MAENLPEYKGEAQIAMPDNADGVASRISDFGNIIQNFSNKVSDFTEKRVGLKEKAQEMVLKTNIDNSMRAFARSSINMFDPKAGVSAFEKQADAYTEKLTEGLGGSHKDAIAAYARHARETNIQPLHTQVVKQAFNEARFHFLESINSQTKDISQGINQVPFSEIKSHHDMPLEAAKGKQAAGLVEPGNINMDTRPQIVRADGRVSTVDTIGVEFDGKHYVIPQISDRGEVLSAKEAITLFKNTGKHLGAFKTQKDADNFAKNLHESEEKKLFGKKAERIAPSVDSVQYNINQTLKNIDGAALAGLIKPDQAVKMKAKILTQANDDMLYHKYQLAVENGQGDKFIQSYAKSQQGHIDAVSFAKHMGQFKKIESLELAQHAISESSAHDFVKDNLKNLELGKPTNPYADSIADRAPALFPAYPVEKHIASLSGGLYQQFTNGTEQQALELYAHFQALNNQHDIGGEQKAINKEAVDTAFKNSTQYFKDLKSDPQRFLLEKNLLGDIATQQKIEGKANAFLPDDLKTPNASTLEASIAWQNIHGIPSNQAQLLTNAQAQEFGGRLLKAVPMDKVKMIQSIQKQYGKYAPNVMQQLIKEGAVPREYGFFTTLDPMSGALPDVVDALTNTDIEYDSPQTASVKTRVNKAMTIATERAHPDVGTTRRVLGFAFQQVKGAVTGREFDAKATNTGLFGSAALFDEKDTTPDMKLKALTESYLSASGYKTGTLINTIDSAVNKLTNFYIKVRGLSEDEALGQATRAITSQYEMVDYRDNIIRMPKHKINYNDLSVLLSNTKELVNKVNWTLPQVGDYGSEATRTDNINYFKQNIENGHWATDATDSGLVWVNANGMVNKMANGNPLFISFESMQKMQRLDFAQQNVTSYLNASFSLFKKNNVSFNPAHLGVPNTGSESAQQIPNSYGHLEKMAAASFARSKEFYDYLFTDMQERQRKFAAKQGGK